MQNRRSVVFILVLVSLLLAVVATQCRPSPEAPATEEPSEPEEETTSEEEPAEPAKIVYWSMFSEGEPLMQELDKATDEFMEEYPNIEVEIKWAGRQVLTQLQSAISAGTQVDIVDHSDDRIYNALVANDLALPLDEYLEEPAYDSDQTWGASFKEASLELGRADDGHIYMVPRDDYISAFFYNKKMLADLGFEPGSEGMTWQEFVDMLETIKQDTDASPLGADGNVAFYNNWWHTYLSIRLAGREAFREAAYDETGEKWGEPEFLEAAQMIRGLQDQDYFQEDFEGSVWPAAQVEWVNGDVAMMFCGAWLPKEMSPQMPEGFEVSMFPFPSVEGGEGNQWVEHWANVYSVLKDTEHPDAAATYLRFILSKEIGTRIANQGTPVPVEGVPVPPSLQNQFEILDEFDSMKARAGLNIEIADYMENVYNVCDDQFFKMELTPEEFIECLQTESEKFWAK